MLPSQLWADLETVLVELAADGLPLEANLFRPIWHWRFPTLLQWQDSKGAELEIRRALEPWPLLCDTPVEGGSTSRFVDSSLRRFELIANPAFRRHYRLELQGRPLPLGSQSDQPLAVRYRLEQLYPCLHPCIPAQVPLLLNLQPAEGGEDRPLGLWQLEQESSGFVPVAEEDARIRPQRKTLPWRTAVEHGCTVDLRL
jgi:uncharacterized protein (DUF2126 family)